MKGSIFTNQVIFRRGQRTTCIYRLTHGKVHVVDSKNRVVFQLHAPTYLNAIEHIFDVPMLKTVRAGPQCQVQPLKWKDSFKAVLKNLKERGLRKNRFAVFEAITAPCFYELMLYGEETQLQKGQQLAIKRQNIYLVVEHAIVLLGAKTGQRLMRLGEGQMLTFAQQEQIVQSEQNRTRILRLPINVVQTIFGSQFRSIIGISKIQRDILELCSQRNQRVAFDMQRTKQKVEIKPIAPQQFENKIYKKWEQYEQRIRVGSSFQVCQLQRRQQIVKENRLTFKALMQMNRKQYGKEYVCSKRLQISRSLLTTTQSKASIYQPASLKQQCGIIKHRHATLYKTNKKERATHDSLLRKRTNQQDETRKLFVEGLRHKKTREISLSQKENVD